MCRVLFSWKYHDTQDHCVNRHYRNFDNRENWEDEFVLGMKRLRYMISSRLDITPDSFWHRNVIWLYKYVSRNLHTVLFCSRPGLAWLAATRVAVDIFTSSCWSYMYIQCITGLTLFQVMACYFLAPSHLPNTYWIIINRVQWKSSAAILEEPWITKISLKASCNPPILVTFLSGKLLSLRRNRIQITHLHGQYGNDSSKYTLFL